MNNHLLSSKLIASLQLLTPEEFKSFGKWLQSPWANPNQKLVNCYAFLKKYHPAFSVKTLTKENLFAKLYPNKKYNDRWMRNIMAAMTKQVESFLVHQRIRKDEVLGKQLLAKEFAERHRNDWYVKQVGQTMEIIEAKKVKETEDHLSLALLNSESYHLSSSSEIIAKGEMTLQKANWHLDVFYSITKWRLLLEMTERQIVFSADLKTKEIIKWLSAMPIDEVSPITKIYKKRIENYAGYNNKQYFELKKEYLKNYDQLSLWDRKLFFLYLTNDVIRLWIKGDKEIIKELFELNKFGLERDLFLHHGRLSEYSYANIVTTANSLGEFDFTTSFILKYTVKLTPEMQQDAAIWANGHLNYKKKKFGTTIDLLSKHVFKNSYFIQIGKALLLQGYYEASLSDESYYLFFNDYCEAYKKYIQRITYLSNDRKLAYLNLISFTKKLRKIIRENKYFKADVNSLEEKIKAERNIQGIKWLSEKVEEAKQRLH